MADSVESLHFELGVNAQPLLDMLDQISGAFNAMVNQAEASGVSLDQMVEGVGSAVKSSITATVSAAESADKAGKSVADIGAKGGAAMAQGVSAGAKKAAAAVQSFDGVAKKAFAAIKSYLAPLLAAAGAKSLFTNFVNEGDQLSKLSEKVRMNVADIDAWRKANVAAGGSSEAFTQAMAAFTQRTGRSAEAFLKMGQRLNGLQGRHADYALKYLGLTRESAAVFLKSNEEMGELVNKYRAFAMSPKDAESARKFKIMWETSMLTLKAAGAGIMSWILPAVNKAVEVFGNAAAFFGRHAQLIKVALGLVGVAATAAFGPKSALAAGSKLLTLIVSPVGAVVAGIAALAVAIDDLITFAQGGNSVFEELLKTFGFSKDEIEQFRASFQGLGHQFDEILRELKPLGDLLAAVFGAVLKVAIEAIVASVAALALGLSKLINFSTEVKDKVIGAFNSIKAIVSDVVDWCEKKLNALLSFFSSIKPPEWVSSLGSKVSGWFGSGNKKADKPDATASDAALREKTATVRGDGELSGRAAGKVANVSNEMKVNNAIQVTINGNADPQATEQAVFNAVDKGNSQNRDLLYAASTGVMGG